MLQIYLTIILITIVCNCQDIIFPDDEEMSHLSGNKVTITERIPIYIPEKCPPNMLLYPGDGNKSAWICDCRPRFLYFPEQHTCQEAYRQGFCKSGEHVVLAPGEVVPKCVHNPCERDGSVLFRKQCYPLRTNGGPCAPDGILGVNETTFQVECIPTDLAPFTVINAPNVPCPGGSRRNSLGICKKPI